MRWAAMARPDHDPALIAAARRGELTRRNTEPGTPERRAVDRATYLRRLQRRPGVSAREAAGHGPRVAGHGTFFSPGPEGPEALLGVALGRSGLRQAGRYMATLGKLASGQLPPSAFRRRVARWAPIVVLDGPGAPVERRFLSDPDAALVLADALRGGDFGDEPLFDSGRRRPTSRSRGR